MKKSKLFFILIVLIELLVIMTVINEISDKKNIRSLNLDIVNSNDTLPKHYEVCHTLSSNTKLVYELNPNCSVYFDGFPVKIPTTLIKINSDGFRDREYEIEKPNNTFRIIVLGDSITFGWGVNISNVYTEVLERKLNSLNNDITYEVLNFGVPGYTTLQEVELFKVKGLKYNSDMVLIAYRFGDFENETKRNELYQEIEAKYENLGYNTSQLYWKERIFREASQGLRDELKNKSFGELWQSVEQPLLELHSITSQNTKFVVFYTPQPTIDDVQYESLKKTAEKYDWYFIETIYELKNTPQEIAVIKPGRDFHPNKLFHGLIAGKIYNFLLEKELI